MPDEHDEDTGIEVTGSRAEYDRFLPEAEAIKGTLGSPYVNAGLAYHNVVAGSKTLLEHEERLKKELPTLDLEAVRSLPQLALGVIYAAGLVDRSAPTPTGPLLDRVSALRAKLLPAAEVLAQAGLMPAHDVARIRKGTGRIDSADDCVALARLFTDHAAAIKGKTAISEAEVREASEAGTEARTVLRPTGSQPAATAEQLARALRQRDQLWTLLADRYEQARRAGAWLYGVDQLNSQVPALGSRRNTKKKAEPAKEAAGEPAE